MRAGLNGTSLAEDGLLQPAGDRLGVVDRVAAAVLEAQHVLQQHLQADRQAGDVAEGLGRLGEGEIVVAACPPTVRVRRVFRLSCPIAVMPMLPPVRRAPRGRRGVDCPRRAEGVLLAMAGFNHTRPGSSTGGAAAERSGGIVLHGGGVGGVPRRAAGVRATCPSRVPAGRRAAAGRAERVRQVHAAAPAGRAGAAGGGAAAVGRRGRAGRPRRRMRARRAPISAIRTR